MTKSITKQLTVIGMVCSGCETKIERKLKALNGVTNVKASFATESVSVTFNENKISLPKIKETIAALGYTLGTKSSKPVHAGGIKPTQFINIALIVLGGFLLMNHFGGFTFFNYFPEAKKGMSYAALFVIGLLTSVHCVGMCGGICLSQCVPQGAKASENKQSKLRPSFLYNLGRVISYTVIGGIVGALGSVISFSGAAKGAVAIIAGVFMVIMGLNMLNIFPWLRKFNLRMPKFLTNGISTKNNSPFYVGLLNGLMPCGPLQAMQLYALSSGSPIKGAISMLLFSLGTVPLMFGFGAVSSMLSKKFTSKMMAVSAVLVIILGTGMFSTGMSLSGIGLSPASGKVQSSDGINIENGVQTVTIDISARSYAPITVKKGVPVKWIIRAEAKNINGCNNEIIVPKYNISKNLQPGENLIEFTPTETGVIPYSCWMGMIRSKITVVE
ncbi:sulfite exporter TauE/SafE family protein [Oscillospiraceae bacterium PP1C4]